MTKLTMIAVVLLGLLDISVDLRPQQEQRAVTCEPACELQLRGTSLSISGAADLVQVDFIPHPWAGGLCALDTCRAVYGCNTVYVLVLRNKSDEYATVFGSMIPDRIRMAPGEMRVFTDDTWDYHDCGSKRVGNLEIASEGRRLSIKSRELSCDPCEVKKQ